MYTTKDFPSLWGELAQHYNFEVRERSIFKDYILPQQRENGWICEVNPTIGLYVASAWITPDTLIEHTFHIDRSCLLLLCIDCGDITFTQRGKASIKLSPFCQMIINPQKPFKLTIPAKSHACFTSVLIYDYCIVNFLTANQFDYPIDVENARKWKRNHIDQSNIMLVMEQIRWGVRSYQMPPLSFLCKAIELLCMIAHNAELEVHQSTRRQHVTWNDELKICLVSEAINKDPINPPNIKEMCRLAEMCESKLRVEFKSLYGMTIYSYVREAIMKRAMQMLADDRLNIKSIATLCGYENAAKFTAVFKKIHGITPSEFRKAFGL
ncbi:MAG: transcriptional regulator, AraC family [Anaerocolumna sp.]|nr:transcriptional regulator, AraC family [Anaerocolumna sp.]